MLPALRIQPRAEFLHGVGPREAIAWFAETLGAVVGPIRVSVSRIGLCADFQGWELDGDERHRFVGRARELDTYENESRLTGFTFGRRTSGTITARIYDKTRDAKNKGADYWPGIWGDAFVEFRCSQWPRLVSGARRVPALRSRGERIEQSLEDFRWERLG